MASKSLDPQNKGAPVRAKYSNNSWQQAEFVTRELTLSEQATLKSWSFTESDAMFQIGNLIEAGYKVTFRLDTYYQSFGCWILPPQEHDDNSGLILTGRGSSAHKAFKQAWYKHAVLFMEVWPRGGDQRGVPEIDD